MQAFPQRHPAQDLAFLCKAPPPSAPLQYKLLGCHPLMTGNTSPLHLSVHHPTPWRRQAASPPLLFLPNAETPLVVTRSSAYGLKEEGGQCDSLLLMWAGQVLDGDTSERPSTVHTLVPSMGQIKCQPDSNASHPALALPAGVGSLSVFTPRGCTRWRLA